MTLVSAGKNTIVSPGTDPCCGDVRNDKNEAGAYDHEWDWGNSYVLNSLSNSIVKNRNLPYMIHGWGAWFDEEKNKLYYAGSGIKADGSTPRDSSFDTLIFVSSDL